MYLGLAVLIFLGSVSCVLSTLSAAQYFNFICTLPVVRLGSGLIHVHPSRMWNLSLHFLCSFHCHMAKRQIHSRRTTKTNKIT
jgi:hypothetical protein